MLLSGCMANADAFIESACGVEQASAAQEAQSKLDELSRIVQEKEHELKQLNASYKSLKVCRAWQLIRSIDSVQTRQEKEMPPESSRQEQLLAEYGI